MAIIVSAFIHMADADVNGFTGLWTFSVLLSVLLIAIPFFICMVLGLLAIEKWGKPAGLGVLAVLSLGCGAMVFLAGTAAATFGQKAIGFLGIWACLLAVFSLGTLIPIMLTDKLKG